MSIYTADEVLSLPIPEDISGYELVNGQLVPVSFSGLRHGWLAGEIGARIQNHVRARGIAGCTYLGSGYVLSLPHDPERLRGPDVSFVSAERLQRYGGETRGFLHGVPDLAVQIESVERPPQLQQSTLDYLDAGTPLLWVIHSEADSATVYHPDGSARLLRETDALDGEDILPGLKIPLNELFDEGESIDGPMTDHADDPPVPELDPGPITLDQYIAFTPEKLELLSGYLIDESESPEQRERLLALLLVNAGLVEVVKRAPRERWLEALDLAYGSRND